MEQEKINIKCTHPKCGYEWKTKSLMIKVSCPSCGNKVRVKNEKA